MVLNGFKRLLGDASWAEGRKSSAWLVGLTTFGILVLELALIRWTSGQVRVFAYVNNIVLIAAFLGMGLGVALGKRYPGLVHGVLPALLLVALPVASAESLGLVHLTFPDQSITLWGAETVQADMATFVRNLAIFLTLLSGVGTIFVCAGAPLGYLFGRLPVLRAYSADLAGSLTGVLVFTALSWVEAGPVLWLALGVLPFLWLVRRWWAVPVAAVIVGLGWYSGQGAIFSPYNRIVLITDPLFLRLEVNRDFHQYLHDVSDARLVDARLTADDRSRLRNVRQLYDLPFILNPQKGTALVVGAGTGNDVQAALRNGYQNVTSVDIDAEIIAIGRRLHPEQPYSHPGVSTVVDDARSFFGKHDESYYDVVCYGLLDSHAMASAMSTLRLDNYVYTEEGIRAAWRHVAPGGHLSLSMACNSGQWFFDRLYWTITKATGRKPIPVYNSMHGGTVTFLVPTDGAQLSLPELAKHVVTLPSKTMAQTPTLSDDWPFLYLRPGVFPWGYLTVLAFILGVAVLTVRPVFGLGREGNAFDWVLFLMGAAFLLIETRGVTSLSLLFGSTWVVNSAVFGGILVMVLLANLAVERWQWRNPSPWFVALFAAVALLWWFPLDWLNTLPLLVRGVLGGLLTGLPVGLAGVIVPMLLSRSAQPAAALGSNLLGAVLGGCLEYYSMVGGLRSAALMALVLYLAAFLLLRRSAGGAKA
ncbi:class I SAM-dependent methyltransferase [Opitutus sp. GAS368]|uniref:methyltransferase domain-containing protein n=1 Tax=Opitutus sp. GAS368 TaxID=1882749 RepID=UPI000879EE7A|nr:class I SAM-dependent methyltransferase [Opitutus sp. GAS368]SDS36670.1 Methyltransferase domain-containing protein [Opitutus sp. GAS368]